MLTISNEETSELQVSAEPDRLYPELMETLPMNQSSTLKANLIQPAFALSTTMKSGAAIGDRTDNPTSFLQSDTKTNHVYNMVNELLQHPTNQVSEVKQRQLVALRPCVLSSTSADHFEESFSAEGLSKINILKSGATTSLELGTGKSTSRLPISRISPTLVEHPRGPHPEVQAETRNFEDLSLTHDGPRSASGLYSKPQNNTCTFKSRFATDYLRQEQKLIEYHLRMREIQAKRMINNLEASRFERAV